jgi:hypothetical protein
MVLTLLPAIAVLLLLLLAVPVYLPRAALYAAPLIACASLFFLFKPGPPPEAKFDWGLDRPLAAAIALYGVLWIATALVSRSRERAAVLEQRRSYEVGRATLV